MGSKIIDHRDLNILLIKVHGHAGVSWRYLFGLSHLNKRATQTRKRLPATDPNFHDLSPDKKKLVRWSDVQHPVHIMGVPVSLRAGANLSLHAQILGVQIYDNHILHEGRQPYPCTMRSNRVRRYIGFRNQSPVQSSSSGAADFR